MRRSDIHSTGAPNGGDNSFMSFISLEFFIKKLFKHTRKKKKSREYSTINPTYPSPVSMNIKILCMFSFSLFLFMSLLLYFKAIPRVYTVLPKRQYLNTEWLRIFQNQ